MSRIRVQNENITENTNARSPLSFISLLLIDVYMKRHTGIVERKENSCSFLVHFPNLQVFAVKNIVEIQNFIPFLKSRGQANIWGPVPPVPRRTATDREPYSENILILVLKTIIRWNY